MMGAVQVNNEDTTNNMSTVIDITEIDRPNVYVSKKMIHIIEKQGLIEPLKLDAAGELTIDPYDKERLAACYDLGWPTIIVAIGDN